MVVVMESRLKVLRQELVVSREKLARKTQNVSMGTIRNAERGERITCSKANEILAAVNVLRCEARLHPLTMDDLGVTLY